MVKPHDHTTLKSGDPMVPSYYRTILIGHLLPKAFGPILKHELSEWVESNRLRSIDQVGFRQGFTTLDHIFTLRAIIKDSCA